MHPQAIPVIVCIDVEPDGCVGGRHCRPPWHGYEKASDFFSGMRPQIEAATGAPAHFSWFYRMDPQIADIYGSGEWPVISYPGCAQEFEQRGDAIGLHTHLYRFDPERNIWLIDNADQAWVRRCIESSCKNFKKAFKRPAFLHRFGDRFLDGTAVSALEQAGCRYDLTPEPGFAEHPESCIARLTTGALPDMLDVPDQPYHPSAENFKQPASSGRDGLWLIPLSTGRFRQGLGKLFRPSELYPMHFGLDCRLFSRVAARLIKTLPKPYIGIVLKTDMLLDVQLVDNMRRNLAFFLGHRLPCRFVFATPEETLHILGYIP